MSAIPPNWASSIVGAHGAQRAAQQERTVEAGAEHRRTHQAAADKSAHESIETADTDTQVDADAEGTGGQGRAFSEHKEDDAASHEPPTPSNGGLDITA